MEKVQEQVSTTKRPNCTRCGLPKPRGPMGRGRGSRFCSNECARLCPICNENDRGDRQMCKPCRNTLTYEQRDRRCHRCGAKKTEDGTRTKSWFCEPCSKRCTRCERPRADQRRRTGGRGYCAYHLWERQIARYGLTGAQWEALFDSQGKRCAICRIDKPGRKPALIAGNAWCTDHDHDTGKVRGILCQYCNKTLGHFGDTIFAMRKRLAQFERYLIQPVLYAGHRPVIDPSAP